MIRKPFIDTLIQRSKTASFLILGLLACVYLPVIMVSCIIATIGMIILLTEWPRLMSGAWWLLTPLYPITPFVLAIVLNQNPETRAMLLLLVLAVSINDTGAYLIGNVVGKHLLCRRISPAKTWQGFFGGWLCVSIFLWCVSTVYTYSLSAASLIGIAGVLASCATAGDLFESWLKRKAGVKDSGTLLPGHGGLLDRCDSIISCIYLLYALHSCHL